MLLAVDFQSKTLPHQFALLLSFLFGIIYLSRNHILSGVFSNYSHTPVPHITVSAKLHPHVPLYRSKIPSVFSPSLSFTISKTLLLQSSKKTPHLTSKVFLLMLLTLFQTSRDNAPDVSHNSCWVMMGRNNAVYIMNTMLLSIDFLFKTHRV